MPRNSSLTRRIVQLQEAVRRKYRAFKLGNMYTEQTLEKQYKPILSELRKRTEYGEPKEEPMDLSVDEQDNFKPDYMSTPTSNTQVYSPSVSPTKFHEASQYVLETFNAPITQKYMLKLLKDEAGVKNKMDNIYGPHIDGDKLMVGNQPLTFDNEGNIHLNNVQYRGTEGIYELLFKRQPDENLYTQDDLDAYKDLLIKTNAHKKGYLPHNHINRPTNSIKYKNIISVLFPKQMTGRGLKDFGSRDISYWDNPNELCDRLKLIIASTEAGNGNHGNEIQNIIEELKEAKIISGAGNSRYKSLVG